MASLTRCSSCRTHILAGETTCPFCKVKLPLKGLLVATAGVVAFVSGIGCAYGCPDGQCGGGGETTTSSSSAGGGTTSSSATTSSSTTSSTTTVADAGTD
jgi:hypothetical protein